MPLSEETRRSWDERIRIASESEELLSSWERQFLASVRRWRARGQDLRMQQSIKLNEVYYKSINRRVT